MNDLQRAARTRKIVYLGLIVGLFTLSMLWRGKLALGDATATDPTALDRLARLTVEAQATDLELSELELGDPEIAGSAARVSLVGFRGVVVTVLWSSAIEKQKRHEYHDFELYARLVTRLQPNFIVPWLYQGWNISYNVSVENEKLGDMFFFIARGIELLSEGDRLNTKKVRRPGMTKDWYVGSPDLRRDVAFFYQNKFTVSDKVATLRCLMALSVIPPEARSPARFLKQNTSEVDEERFRQFFQENPQLVRRLVTPRPNLTLGEKVTDTIAGTPLQIADFLAANAELPSRWEKNGRTLKAPEAQFPTLPPVIKADDADAEYHPGHPDMNPDNRALDRFDALLAARAWFQYANEVAPQPLDDLANAAPDPKRPRDFAPNDPNAEYKYRMPAYPALIVFRYYPARAQTYLAERLQKEGWYDADTRWGPDVTTFFPAEHARLRDEIEALARAKQKAEDEKAGDDVKAKHAQALADKVKEASELGRVRARRNSFAEWNEANARWDTFGKANGLKPTDATVALQEAAEVKTRWLLRPGRPLPHDLSPSELAKDVYALTPEEQAALPTRMTEEDLRYRKAHDYLPQNLQVTNYRRFQDEALAESTREMVAARKRLLDAEAVRAVGGLKGAAEYAAAIAEWRRALDGPNTRAFHRNERSEQVHEYSFELEQKLATEYKMQADVKRTVETALAGLQIALPAVTVTSVTGVGDPTAEPALLAAAPFAGTEIPTEPDPFRTVAVARKDLLQVVAEERAVTEIAVRMRMRALDPTSLDPIPDTLDADATAKRKAQLAATEAKARAEVADPNQFAYLKRGTEDRNLRGQRYEWVRQDIRDGKLEALGFRRKPDPNEPPAPLPGDPPRVMPGGPNQ